MNSNAELNVIAALDLDPIKVKLMHKESGEGWSRAQVDAVELEYRRFLCLMKLFPREQVSPWFDVDVFWHYHILDTMKYAADCEHVFGYFLHHFPYTGLGGEDDEVDQADHRRSGARMQELYEATFGEDHMRRVEDQPLPALSQQAPKQTAWSPRVSANMAQTAWSTGVSAKMAQTAWSTGVSASAPQTAWSTGVSANAAQTAWSTGVSANAGQTAWPTGVSANTAQTAWSTGVSAKIKSLQGALPIMARPRLEAQNDCVYAHQALALAA